MSSRRRDDYRDSRGGRYDDRRSSKYKDLDQPNERDYRDRDRDRDRDYKDRDYKERDYKDRDYKDNKDRERDRGRSDRGRSDRDREEDKKRKDDRDAEMEPPPPPPELAPPPPPAENVKKLEPIAIEELMKKRAEEEKNQMKPVFLTKAERQKIALEKRNAQVAEQKDISAAHQGIHAHPEPPKEEEKEKQDDKRDSRGDRDREREREKDRREKDRLQREKDRELRHKERNRQEGRDEDSRKYREAEKELESIKNQYLGIKKEKKKIIKPSEKFKFVFNWDLSEDTSRDTNPLYNNKLEIRPMFGRGLIAGIDKKEQLKSYRSIASRRGDEVKDEGQKDNMKREKDKYDKQISQLTIIDLPGAHWTEKTLEQMHERDWRILKEDFNITTKGGSIPNPMRNWKESRLPDELLEGIKSCGYKAPTAIQMQAIPIGLQGRDIIGVAETGSGKTASFVLPMLVYISKLPKMTPEIENDGPYALIMAPTRELVQQIESETIRFASYLGFRCVSLVGGQSIDEQGFLLRKGAEIVIATPGRLNDCLERRFIVLNQCNYVVLDEADRMIDMGFEPQVNTILDAMPAATLKSENEEEAEKQEKEFASGAKKYRITTMYSATMPTGVERLARKYLRRPAYIAIGEAGKTVDKIKQVIEFVKTENDKRRKLEYLLETGPQPPIIVFANKKKSCDVISKHLEKLGYRSTSLHAGRVQEQRELAMEGFRAGRYDVLVATDVAGRGIDVKGVTHVINYDMPKSIEDYTHRIGRTGRAGESGLATSFITNEDTDIMYDLKAMLQNTGNVVPNELAKHPSSQHKSGTVPDRQKRSDTVIFAK